MENPLLTYQLEDPDPNDPGWVIDWAPEWAEEVHRALELSKLGNIPVEVQFWKDEVELEKPSSTS